MREIVEREPKDGGDGENFDDIGAACHWYNSNLREADIVGDLLGDHSHCHYPQKLHVFLLGSSTLEPIKIGAQGPTLRAKSPLATSPW
jgi:hypothetical protein